MAEPLSFKATGASSFTPGPYRARLVRIERRFKQREKAVYDPVEGKKVLRGQEGPQEGRRSLLDLDLGDPR